MEIVKNQHPVKKHQKRKRQRNIMTKQPLHQNIQKNNQKRKKMMIRIGITMKRLKRLLERKVKLFPKLRKNLQVIKRKLKMIITKLKKVLKNLKRGKGL